MTVVPSYDASATRIPGVVADSGASFRWNVRRLERGWRGSPSCTAPRQLTYSTATNRVVRKNAPQLIPGLIGTPAAAEHKTAPDAKVAGGFDFSLQEFLNCVRTGKGGLGMLEPALPNASKLGQESNIQPDFNVRVIERIVPDSSAVLRELDESNRSVQKLAKTTSIWPS